MQATPTRRGRFGVPQIHNRISRESATPDSRISAEDPTGCRSRYRKRGNIMPNQYWLTQNECISRAATWVMLMALGTASAAQNSVVVWGNSSMTNVPAEVTNVGSVTAGYSGCVAVGRDGQLHSWGYIGGTLPPVATNAVSVAMVSKPVILRRDGSVVYRSE